MADPVSVAVAHAIPPHRFVAQRVCPTCTEAVRTPHPLSCRSRCPGDARGPCGMPLRTPEEVEEQRCAACASPEGMPEWSGLVELAAAVAKRAREDLVESKLEDVRHSAEEFFRRIRNDPDDLWGQIAEVAGGGGRHA